MSESCVDLLKCRREVAMLTARMKYIQSQLEKSPDKRRSLRNRVNMI